MKIKVLAASDRNNYGDLLFPLVIKKFIENNSIECDFRNYGIIKSDLSHFGALPTGSYDTLLQDLKKEKDNTKIIIAGGEVLGGEWLNILRFISPFWNKLHKRRLSSAIVRRGKLLENYFYFFKKSSHPFVLDHPFYKGVQIIYNSVGALGAGNLLRSGSRYKKYFTNVSALTIRDRRSVSNFEAAGIRVKLVPDSALIMSDIFTYELENLVSDNVKELGKTDYAFVQLGQTKGPDDLEKFKHDLEVFSGRNNLKIVLCPIGLAMDHNDQAILMKLAGMSDRFVYIDPQNIYDIMRLIKNSKIYLGTSLHGIITAQSFGVPSVAFTRKIRKLEYYINTWFDSAKDIIAEFGDFDKVENRLKTFNTAAEQQSLLAQKKLIYDNLLSFFHE